MSTSGKWITALAVAATACSLSFPSNAAQSVADDAPSRRVKAWDLDLAKAADVATLYARVQQAAEAVCRDEAKSYYRSTRRQPPVGWSARCVSDAVDAAIRDAGNRRLAALRDENRRLL